MSEYYAVERSGDSLKHYGVKGMRWGVKKAIERGNSNKLARQYKKASKKLAKLENKANIDYQKKRIKNASNKQKLVAMAGSANIGIAGGLTAASYTDALKRAKKGINSSFNVYIPTGAGIAAADIAVRQIGKNKAKKLASAEGHKQAVKNANAFRGEMKKAFKGTVYGNNVGAMAKDIAAKKRRRVENNITRYEQSKIGNTIEARYGNNKKNSGGPRHSGRRK